jgi:hypothetical protein
MFNGMGIQWAGTLLGCVALLLVPIPVGFYLYGRKLRERSRFSPTMADKPPPEEETETDEEEGVSVGREDAGAGVGADTGTGTGTGMTVDRGGGGVDGDVEKKV